MRGLEILIINVLSLQISIISAVNSIQSRKNEESSEETRIDKYGPVIFANMLYRHGDRTILRSYPKDPHKNSEHWNVGYGKLTKKGEEKSYQLGKWIKTKYHMLIREEYSDNDLYVISSDVDRCIMSAECVLAGMYPVTKSDGISIQPVPVHTIPISVDNMLHANVSCPKYDKEFGHAQNSASGDLRRKIDILYKNLTMFTGTEVKDVERISYIYDTLKIQHEEYQLDLPNWAQYCYPDLLEEVSLFDFLSRTKTKQMKKLKSGPLLTDMLTHLKQKATGIMKPDRKLWMYSAHDETIVSLLDTLNLYKPAIKIPSYSSLFVTELRKKGDQHFVTFMYKDGENDTAIELIIDKCGDSACTLQQLIDITKNVTVDDWGFECSLLTRSLFYHRAVEQMEYPVLLIGAVLLTCPLIYCSIYLRPKRSVKYHKLENESQ